MKKENKGNYRRKKETVIEEFYRNLSEKISLRRQVRQKKEFANMKMEKNGYLQSRTKEVIKICLKDILPI